MYNKLKVNEKKVKIILLIFASFMLFLYVFYTFKQYIASKDGLTEISVLNDISENVVGAIKHDASYSVEQTFLSQQDTISGIELMFGTYEKVNNGKILVELYESKENVCITSFEINTETLSDNQYYRQYFTNIIPHTKDKMFRLKITPLYNDENSAVTLWKSNSNTYNNGDLYINSEKQEGDLSVNILSKVVIVKHFYIVISLFSIVFSIYMGFILLFKNRLLQNNFLAILIFFGLVYSLLLPPFSAPDEIGHFSTAYNTSNLILGKEGVKAGKVYCRNEENKVKNSSLPSVSIYKEIITNFFNKSTDNTMDSVTEYGINQTSIIANLPQALGITFARLLDFGYVGLLYSGRLFGLLFNICLIYFSVKIIPFAKNTICVITFLPMVLEQISSFSYDSTIFALSILFIAYCMHLIYQKERVKKYDVVILAIILALLAPCKIVYFLLGFMFLAIPKTKFAKITYYYTSFVVIMMSGILTLLIINIGNVASSVTSSGNLPWIDEPAYSLSNLLTNPIQLIQIYVNTILEKSYYYFNSMLGGVLGWGEIPISHLIIYSFFIILLLTTIKTKDDSYQITKRERTLFIGIVFLTYCAILLAMLLNWTPVSYSQIEGVQGRYFLPILPVAVIALRNNKIFIRKNIDGVLLYLVVLLNCLTCQQIIQKTFMR